MTASPDRPTFTVIVTVYNHEAYVGAAIESVLAQTDPDFDVLAVDDGSTDGTPAVLDSCHRRDARVRVLRKENGGVSTALNLGVREAKGEWILWLGSDDTFTPDKLATHRRWFALRPDVRFFFTHFAEKVLATGGIRQPDLWQPVPDERWQVIEMLRCPYVHANTVCVHRDLFAQVGPFDESLRMAQDYDMWMRLAARSPACFIPDRTCLMGIQDMQNTKRFPHALLYDAAKSCIRFLNEHAFGAIFPRLDLENPATAVAALDRAVDIAASPHAHLYKLGPHPALVSRIVEWVASLPPGIVRRVATARFRVRARTAVASLDGHRLRDMWLLAEAAVGRGSHPPVHRHRPVDAQALLDAAYWRLAAEGNPDAAHVREYARRFERRHLPAYLGAPKAMPKRVLFVLAPGASITDSTPYGALRASLRMARETARHGHAVTLAGLGGSAFGLIEGLPFAGFLNDIALLRGVSRLGRFGTAIAVGRSDVLPRVRARRLAVYHHSIHRIPGEAEARDLNGVRISVICVSRHSRQVLSDWGMASDLLAVVPNAYDAEAFGQVTPETTRSEHALVFAGNTLRYKGLDTALAAFRLLRRDFPDATLDVFGDVESDWSAEGAHDLDPDWVNGSGRLLWDHAVRDLPGLTRRGAVPPARLAQAFAASSLLLMPSRTENFPLVSLEAQACGCIPVLARVGGMPETVREGETGFAYDPNTPDELARTVAKLWHAGLPSPEQRDAARCWVSAQFSWEKSGTAFVEALTRLVALSPLRTARLAAWPLAFRSRRAKDRLWALRAGRRH